MMKKLNRGPEPEKLKREKEKLTQQYCREEKKTAVWRKSYIAKPLYESSYRTCVYCGTSIVLQEENNDDVVEIELNKEDNINSCWGTMPNESNFMHIDHFVAKKIKCDLVVEWSNLIPACPKCNIKKGGHDVMATPIVNPYEEDPRDYFCLDGNFIQVRHCSLDKQRSIMALKTLSLFDLINRIVKQTTELCNYINSLMESLVEKLENSFKAMNRNDWSELNQSLCQLMELMKKGLPCADYGALVASIILKHPAFKQIKQMLVDRKLWNNGFIELENELKKIAYV